ncbi:DUF5071 domain-containing protein [Bacteroides xylanisolvens]|nr:MULTISPECIES: DUF5071 domain-containing protein [Bacteroides]MBS5639048.1 DUF5071 domain-containing protein [Bacteroides sp.]MBV3617979.1 DUF5071 domain-containing protein [Bacteroides xylanisolvens]MDB0709480.1 DUF5071 domain-containing protein [Bacteroides xylanisolvens]MDB0716885.1 DUF5071 domain-containing protein [Bacteroides xylanisolvens]MDB0737556.1 DUF5071 domain-containing protein [Bacteroides xylanisolvens]
MNEQKLIPKDKFDLDAAKRLSLATPEQVSAVATPLLEWIADMNWPVALEIIHVLPKFHKELLPSIEPILLNRENDIIWKYWIISQLLIQFPKESLLTLLPIIQEYADLIPHNEDEEDLKEVSLDFLAWYNKRE